MAKLRVAVLRGGRSLERDVSLKSGTRVGQALEELGHEVIPLDVDEALVGNLLKAHPDVVYIALHGKYGEDGTIQELLEILDIPYTGPDAYANMIAFDKVLAKENFIREGIPTPKHYALGSVSFKEMGASAALAKVVEKLGMPLVVKPARQGSALGIKIAKTAEELPRALIGALSYDSKVVIEQHIKGREVAVSIIGNDEKRSPLPVVEIVTNKEFFDFEAMYTMGQAEYFVPARLSPKKTRQVQETALAAHRAVGGRDVSRVDIIIDENGIPQVLEVNSSPGMTETSLLPMAARQAGMEFVELVGTLLESAMSRKGGVKR